MTPLELATLCADVLSSPELGSPRVTLSIPKGRYPRAFPRGELLNERRTPEGIERTYSLDAQKLLDKLVATGLVKVERVPQAETPGTTWLRITAP